MKRSIGKVLALILAAVSLMALPVAALADLRGEEMFPDINDFYADGIGDVAEDWGLPGIVAAYDTGLMTGTGAGKFSPDSTFTVAQAVTVAVRIQAALEGYDAGAGSGGKWYSGYVELARTHGILGDDEFTTDEALNAPVTRGQMAGIFYKAVSGVFGSEDKLNDIVFIGDVETGSGRYEPIRYLMELGILTGYDDYGTFRPDNTITRKEAAAVVARVVRPELRVEFATKEKPNELPKLTDLTVYTTDRLVSLDGVYFSGVFEIGGEFFIPVEGLNEYSHQRSIWNSYGGWYKFYFSQEDGDGERHYKLEIDPRYSQPDGAVGVYQPTCSRRVVGTAELSPYALEVETVINKDESKTQRFYGAIATIGGECPMLRLSVIGYKDDGCTLKLNSVDPDMPVVYEHDLLGEVLPSLQRDTAYDTALAIHDYLVNTCTYDPTVSAASYFTRSMIEKAAQEIEAAREIYKAEYNVMLASHYGVCDDYSKTFLEMCLRSGIPCMRVTGVGNGDSHAWNKVYIDGEWKYVDCTWDDPLSSKPVLKHDYFLVDAQRMARGHYWYGTDYPLPLDNPPWDEWAKIDPDRITSADDFRKRLLYEIHQGKTEIVLTTTSSAAFGGIECIQILDEYGEGFFGAISATQSGGGRYIITITDDFFWDDGFFF